MAPLPTAVVMLFNKHLASVRTCCAWLDLLSVSWCVVHLSLTVQLTSDAKIIIPLPMDRHCRLCSQEQSSLSGVRVNAVLSHTVRTQCRLTVYTLNVVLLS